MSLSSFTTDHNAIRSWAACRRAVPAELLPDATAVGPTGLRFLFLDGSMMMLPRAVKPTNLNFPGPILPSGATGTLARTSS